jgi:hypothetical protein
LGRRYLLPEENGLGLTTPQATNELTAVQDFFRVAIMQVNAAPSILTFNGSHFERFSGVTVLDPAQI